VVEFLGDLEPTYKKLGFQRNVNLRFVFLIVFPSSLLFVVLAVASSYLLLG
jgi:hypothetical protein